MINQGSRMKKITIIIGLTICAVLLFQLIRMGVLALKTNSSKQKVNIAASPLPNSNVKSSTVTMKDITYEYQWFEVPDIKKLSLIANFTEKKNSAEILETSSCSAAINGGYYDTNGKPLGLFINSDLRTQAITSALVNGYVSVSDRPSIFFELQKSPTMAVQTGPMLIENGKTLPLVIKNDEFSRRMVAAMNIKGTLLFIAVFVPNTKVQGPQLADLPSVVETISKKLPFPLIKAINLDGGNASIFKNQDTYIQETTPVGSIFCVQK